MANYKQSTVNAGAAWTRSYQVVVDNKYNEVPVITFNEEEIVDTGSTVISKHVFALQQDMSDPTVTFNLVHPVTGDVIGTASYQDAYVMLSSLYLSLALKRDANSGA